MDGTAGAGQQGMLQRLRVGHIPIAYRLALAFTLLISSGMLLLGLVIARDQSRLLEQQMADFGHTVARQLAEAAKEPLLANDTLTLEVITSNLVTHERILGAAVYSAEGKPVYHQGLVPAMSPKALTAGGSREWRQLATGGREQKLISFVAPVRFRDLDVGHVLVTFDRSVMGQAKRDTLRVVIGTTFLLIFLGIVASVALGKRLTRPITELMDATRAISAGDYRVRFRERRSDELGQLMSAMDTMAEGLLRKEQVEKAFSRYVSPNVAQEVMNDLERVRLGGRHLEATVLFADIVGFTAMSETMQPEEVSALLNEYFTYIAHAAEAYGGHVDKYIGDCAMLVFGVPVEEPDHVFHAVACGVLIREVAETLNRRRATQGKPLVHFRIGINAGRMLAGNMGSTERMEYTVVGDAVNLASRLASVAGAEQIVISEEVHAELGDRAVCEPQSAIKLRGKRQPVATYLVEGLAEEHVLSMEEKFAHVLGYEVLPV